MLNQQKVAHLTTLIKASKILTDNEKSDWLGLVELMNDKQLGELEDILVNTKSQNSSSSGESNQPTQQSAATKPDLTAEAVPSLSHISNLPVGLTQIPKPAKPSFPGSEDYNTPASLRSAFVQSGQRLTQSPGAPANTTFSQPKVPQSPKPQQQPSSEPPINRAPIGRSPSANSPIDSDPSGNEPKASSVTAPKAEAQPRHEVNTQSSSPKPEPQKVIQQTEAEINDLSDVNELTFQEFRYYYYESTLKAVQDLVMRLGYFAVIVALENSPAYRTYINTGKMLLGDNSQDPSQMFTKAEFEKFTDLLLDMRVNVN